MPRLRRSTTVPARVPSRVMPRDPAIRWRRWSGRTGAITVALVLGLGAGIPGVAPTQPAVAASANATHFSAGESHVCARRTDGSVWCWGRNHAGQLGDETTTDSSKPVKVKKLTNVTRVAAGGDFSCAIRPVQGARIACWGSNAFGQLGVGHTAPRKIVQTVQLPPTVVPVQIVAGKQHACVRTDTRAVYCWGRHSYGQVGAGKPTNQPITTPVPVSDGDHITAGTWHTCAVRKGVSGQPTTQETLCWGRKGSWLGAPGALDTSQPVPVQNSQNGFLRGIVEVAGGLGHTCGRRSDGRVDCWGSDGWGQLGDGNPQTGSGSGFWRRVKVLDDARELAAGNDHTCARRADRTVWCWGSNRDMQLNRKRYNAQLGTGITSAKKPIRIKNLSGVAQVSVNGPSLLPSADFSCVRKTDRSIWCWGSNRYGQLGKGGGDSRVPVEVQF